jgi:hypothetical protein
LIRLACAVLLAALAGLAAAPLSAVATADGERKADLSVVAAFDKPAYTTEDTFRLDVTISNAGPAVATKVAVGYPTGNIRFDPPGWGDLAIYEGPGVRLEPGQSITVALTGAPNQFELADGALRIGFQVSDSSISEGTSDPNYADNQVSLEVPLTQAHGDFAGTVYADRNGDGVLSPGEGMSGISVGLSGGVPYGQYTTTTDVDGHFAFQGLPVGRYSRSAKLPPGWATPIVQFSIDSKKHDDVLMKAESLSNVLAVSVKFAKDSYSVREKAHLTVVLANSGSTDLTGIVSLCTGAGFGFEIEATPEGWGDLAEGANGITVAAHETRTLDVWSVVPDGAASWGFVGAACFFHSANQPDDDPAGFVMARVPGGTGAVGGRLVYDRDSDGKFDGDGVANTKIVLLDSLTHAVTARAVTDADGHFSFRDVPAFNYDVSVVGPWKIVGGADFGLQVIAGTEQPDKAEILVVPGAEQPDPDAPPAPAPPAEIPPQADAAPSTLRLANTGAAVTPLIVWGSGLVVVGFVLVLWRLPGFRPGNRRPGAVDRR